MITSENFRELLKFLGFTHDLCENIFTYEFSQTCKFLVDFTNEKLIYPEAIKGREHNNNFSQNENFVVFECVFKLLNKGYRPEDIELEKTWTLGRTQKGGRADICVYENSSDNVLMIIECKTWGKEFTKALDDTKTNGAQLFSYWQQESSAKWLVLYSSDNDGKYKSPAINCTDDKNLILMAEHNKNTKLYINAHTTIEKFNVWHETYGLELYDDIIFSQSSAAYNIGFIPLLKKNLRDFNPNDKIVNRFEEILRHNNVSDKENAFNRLIALFICKLVDEIKKDNDSEVEFQYRPRIDNYEMLQDRLQRLYTEGMKEFMREDISYISSDYPEKLFSNYTAKRKQAAINDLKSAFRILKYFSNNDFAFKDVHNENLFYQNGKILVEIVQLFQGYKIVNTEKHQFLGDLFEQLLDKGFKQNEGQFFTPMPLTRFIWDCLPMRNFQNRPKVIDYACGAGHFLIEAVEAINYFIPDSEKNNHWVRDFIFGIEKDYRLARVSKVSLFMNGAGESNIIFGDGLENSSQITPHTFNILTANPPYSVEAFKQHLQINNKDDFTLLDTISNAGSEIEVLFIERIAQLLDSQGLAAVILPSSILSNDSASYTGARSEILRNFKIRAIVRLGSKTFGATGTNTVILFLQRYDIHPPRTAHVSDSVDAIFDDADLLGWEENFILSSYLELQGITQSEWADFINENLDMDNTSEYFMNYYKTFMSKPSTKKISPEYINKNFYEFAKSIEREKIFYYGMTYNQMTVIIIAPSDNAGQKDFLGYDWSGRKGDEGIKISVKGGKLYNDKDREAENTLAHVVRQSFNDEDDIFISEENSKFARVTRTSDMLDFTRGNFNMAINLQFEKKIDIESKYPLVKLISVCQINISKSEAKIFPDNTPASFLDMSSISTDGKIITMTDKPIKELWTGSYIFFAEGDIIIAKMMSGAENMKCAIAINLTNKIGFGSSEFYVLRCNKQIIAKYLFEYIMQHHIRESAWKSVTGTGRMRVPLNFYANMTIPLPPMDIQREIVRECEEIDAQESQTLETINTCRTEIEKLFTEIDALPTVHKMSLDDKSSFTLMIGKRVLNSELITGGLIPVYSANVFEPFGYINNLLFDDFSRDSILWGIDGDFMVNFITSGQKFYPTDHCGVLRVLTQHVNPRYMAHILEREGISKGFSRSYRASLDRISSIKFEVTDVATQNHFMDKVIKLEALIRNCQGKLKTFIGIKESVLKKYLQ